MASHPYCVEVSPAVADEIEQGVGELFRYCTLEPIKLGSAALAGIAQKYYPDYKAAAAKRFVRPKIVEPWALYRQQTMAYPIPIDPEIAEEYRIGEAVTLRASREYLRGARTVDGREFVFDDSAFMCKIWAKAATGENVMNAYYTTYDRGVAGLQRKCSYEYDGGPSGDDRDPIIGYFRDEVTPRFLGGEFTIDGSFQQALRYACEQEREYRSGLAQCG